MPRAVVNAESHGYSEMLRISKAEESALNKRLVPSLLQLKEQRRLGNKRNSRGGGGQVL